MTRRAGRRTGCGPASLITSSYSARSTAKASGPGMPFLPTLPSRWRASTARNHSSVRPAGLVRHNTLVGPERQFHIWWTAPAGISIVAPGGRSRLTPSTRVRRYPSTTSKCSSWPGWKCFGGGSPWGP
jgi:hypothetical protein